MEIIKSVFKIPPPLPIQYCEPITLLDTSFAHYSSTLLIWGRGEKHKSIQIPVFPKIFVTDCLKSLQNVECGVLLLLILNQIEAMYLSITSLLYNFCNPNKQLKYLGK